MNPTISKTALKTDFDKMLSFRNRMTGTRDQMAFIEYIKSRLTELDIPYYVDPFFFRRWEATGSSLEVLTEAGAVEIPVSSEHPYSGETPEEGIVEELVYVKTPLDYPKARGKIAVIEVKNVDFIPGWLAFQKKSAWPETEKLPARYTGTVVTSFVRFFNGMLSKLAGARGAVLVWKNLPDEMIQGQYLPFILGYQGLPILWVNETNGNTLIAAAKEHKRAHLTLTADVEENAYTETVYCMLRGRSDRECVVVNTHTDGPNCVEENGAPAMLQMLEAMKDKDLDRTYIFLFATGHFRLPEFMDPLGTAFQASSRWLSMHRQLWNGKGGHMRAVACLTLEHLGCMEWIDVGGEYLPTGKIQPELVYTGNRFVDQLYIDEVKENRTRVRTITCKGHPILHFGEGENFFLNGIPDIALCTAPEYLCAKNPSQEIEKFDLDLMTEQTQTFLNLALKLEQYSAKEIGRSDFLGERRFSLGTLIGKL